MNFYEKIEYNYSDIQMLIVDEIEENLHLDYKDVDIPVICTH